MRWERVQANARLREPAPEGKKSLGRIGGVLGPGRRWGHTCNSVRGGRFLYVFGGYGKDNCQTNDVHVFDSYKQTWSKPMVKGMPPSPRDSHSCTTVGNNLFVFGGTDGKNPLSDLHVLDTSTNTWMKPNVTGVGPAAREGHSAALIDKRLFIFGGCGKSCDDPEELYYSDLFMLDTENFVWHHATTSGTPPSARDSHTCSSWKNQIIVIGGEDSSDYYLSDVYIFDADKFIWRELQTSGQVLTPRAGHSTVALGKHMFVFGGFTDDRNLYDDLHALNVETGVWIKISSAGMGPTARFSVAGDCLDPLKGVLVFMGGCNENLEALDDMYYLYTDMLLQDGLEEPRQEKLSIRRELKKKCQEQYHLPVNKGFFKCDMIPNVYQPVTLKSCDQGNSNLEMPSINSSSQKIFEAKVTDMFHCGYTIETIIDGKPLRGILFSYNPNFGNAAQAYLSRKRLISDGIDSHDGHDLRVKVARTTDQKMNNSEYVLADNCQRKRSTLESSPALPVASNSSNLTTIDILQPPQATENMAVSPAPDLNSMPAGPDDLQKVEMEGNDSSSFTKRASSPKKKDESMPSNKESDLSVNGLLVKPV